MTMDRHVQVLGILHIVYSGLAFVGGCIAFALFLGIGAFVSSMEGMPGPAEDNAPAILAIIGTVIGASLIICSIPGIIGGIGVLNRKEWARILVLVISFFDLLFIPLGTLLGVYSLWVLFNDETISLFRSGTLPQPSRA